MDFEQTLSQLTELPPLDRLRVVETLWDSLSDHPIASSDSHSDEVRRRVAAHEANPEELLTWDEVLERLRASRK